MLYNCRSPRPREIDGKDYHFRSREVIEGLREKKNFIVLDVRGDLQAVDLNDAERTPPAGDLFFEGNPFVGRKLQEEFASKVHCSQHFSLAALARGKPVSAIAGAQSVVSRFSGHVELEGLAYFWEVFPEGLPYLRNRYDDSWKPGKPRRFAYASARNTVFAVIETGSNARRRIRSGNQRPD